MKSNIKSIDNQTARKRLNILSITFAFNTLAGSIVFPFLPIYLHTIRGIPMSTVGLIFPVMGLAMIIGSPFSGYLADRFGRRIVMVIGPLLRSVSHFSLALMAATNAPFLVITIGLFFAFFLGTFFQNSANAYATDLIHVKDRTLAFSKIRVGLNIGWMIGPAIGAFLARTPFALLFLLTGSFCLLTALTVYKLCPDLLLNEGNPIHDRALKISFPEILRQVINIYFFMRWDHIIQSLIVILHSKYFHGIHISVNNVTIGHKIDLKFCKEKSLDPKFIIRS